MRGQRYASAALYPGKDPIPIVQKAGWVPGPVWTGAENLAPTGFRSLDLPARSQSLYRLSYRPTFPRFWSSHIHNYNDFLLHKTHFEELVDLFAKNKTPAPILK
jgi:hypothetical protein